jgi:outer membrane protein insertion porin family
LQIAQAQYDQVISTPFGCPQLDTGFNCAGGNVLNPKPSQFLSVLNATNWKLRMSTGLELQMFLPVINAPFRIYWAYNPLRLDTPANPPIAITPEMFPGSINPVTGKWEMTAAGAYTYKLAKQTYAPSFLLREPRKTFRFTVATTF